jgi:hypothetical protein
MDLEIAEITNWDTFIQKTKELEDINLGADGFQVWKRCLDWIAKRSALDNDPEHLHVVGTNRPK